MTKNLKKIIIILLFLILIVLVSLLILNSNKKIKPIEIEEEYYNNNELIDINKKELEELEKEKKSFILFIYLPGCSSCAAFSEVLKEFQEKNNITIYKTEIKYAKDTSIGKKIKYAPSFVVYKEGKYISYLDPTKDADLPYYEDVNKFTDWLIKYVILKVA